jgi:proprotein convertase subtilisin/kexin type 5
MNVSTDAAVLKCEKNCPTNCKTCDSTGVCSKCVDGFTPKDNTCLCSGDNREIKSDMCVCSANYFENSDGDCQACGVECLDCQETGCAICQTKFYSNKGTCEACSNTFCSKCPGDKCTDCTDVDKEVKAGEDKCSCKAKMFNASTDVGVLQCKACPSNCSECADESICDKCDDGFEKDANNECTNCKTGWFKNGSGACQKCDPLCDDCDKAGDCKTCTENAAKQADNK